MQGVWCGTRRPASGPGLARSAGIPPDHPVTNRRSPPHTTTTTASPTPVSRRTHISHTHMQRAASRPAGCIKVPSPSRRKPPPQLPVLVPPSPPPASAKNNDKHTHPAAASATAPSERARTHAHHHPPRSSACAVSEGATRAALFQVYSQRSMPLPVVSCHPWTSVPCGTAVQQHARACGTTTINTRQERRDGRTRTSGACGRTDSGTEQDSGTRQRYTHATRAA